MAGLAETHRTQVAAVCAAPDDDRPRLVLADTLIEAGDPLGEFISLQVAAGRRSAKGLARQREKALIAAHGPSWVPRGLTDVVFLRGFVSAGLLRNEAEPNDFRWQLIERLSVYRGYGEALLAGELRSLREFNGMGPRELSGVLSGPPRPLLTTLRTVGLTPRELLSRVSPLLPNLATLVCEDIPNLSQGELEVVLKAAPSGLQRLRVPASNLPLKFAQQILASTRSTLALELSYGDCSIEVSGAGVRRIDDSPDSEVERLISERLQALGLREVELERRGAAQRAPLHFTADVRFYPAVEPAPIRVRVSTAPPPAPTPPGSAADWD